MLQDTKQHNNSVSEQGWISDRADREAGWGNREGKHKKKGEKISVDSPSHTILCWHGKKWMSKASSEQTRHSVGTATLETLRLVMVLGVVCTRRRLQVMVELSEETCCSLQAGASRKCEPQDPAAVGNTELIPGKHSSKRQSSTCSGRINLGTFPALLGAAQLGS